MTCWGVIPAAGVGRRMQSDMPKQYMTVAGMTLLEHSLRALLVDERIRAVSVALREGDEQAAQLPGIAGNARVSLTVGGDERSDSVAAGLDHLQSLGAAPGDWVLVHDAARPCLPRACLSSLIDAALSTGHGAILAQAVPDTVKRGSEGRVVATVSRSDLWLAQTPQMFRLGELRQALEVARERGHIVTDEASAMELVGAVVQLVTAPRCNLKVTSPEDIELVEYYLGSGA